MALQIGEWDVDGLMDAMPATLLNEWMAFSNLEPFGAFEDEFHAATISSIIANTARNEEEKPQPFKPTDFMRDVFTDEIKKEPVEVAKKMSNVFAGFGSKRLPGT